MKNLTFLMATTLVLVSISPTASADTIAMGYIGPQGNNSGGIYTYPYNFTLDGSGNYPLMCDSFSRRISPGQNWNATTLTVDNLNAVTVLGLELPSVGVLGYLEASYLFVQQVNAYNANNSDSGLYNWAVWDLMSQSNVSTTALSPAEETQVQVYLAAAEALGNGGSLTPSQFSDVVIYTPVDMSSGGPQEFFGYGTPVVTVPEPGTLTLVGVGAIGLLAIVRRKK